MNELNLFYNAKAEGPGFTLCLDIKQKNNVITDLFLKSDDQKLLQEIQKELNECRDLFIGRSLEFVMTFNPQHLLNRLHPQALKPLIYSQILVALENFSGDKRVLSEAHDVLCLCFMVRKSDVEDSVVSDKDFNLSKLIAETKATSACGTCRESLNHEIEKSRLSHGLIYGLDHSRSHFDKNGNWIKINNKYPGPLVLEIDESIKKWLDREGVNDHFALEIKNIEGFHLDVYVTCNDPKKIEPYLEALTLHLKNEFKVLFFLHASF